MVTLNIITHNGLQLVIRFAFKELKLHRLEANIQPDNVASIEFILRNGFIFEGISKKYLFLNNAWRDHAHYVLINDDL